MGKFMSHDDLDVSRWLRDWSVDNMNTGAPEPQGHCTQPHIYFIKGSTKEVGRF